MKYSLYSNPKVLGDTEIQPWQPFLLRVDLLEGINEKQLVAHMKVHSLKRSVNYVGKCRVE